MAEERMGEFRERTVSVVIPVYNSEDTVGRCIGSVAGQDYRALEIIVVDDGSEDRSGEVCDEWGRKDGRVKVIHQENRGRSAARWAGVEAASSEWVAFVDSDDRLPRSAISDLYAAAVPEVDIVLGNGRLLGKHYKERIPMDEFRHLAVRAEGTIGVPWGSLFRRAALTPYVWDIPREICMGEDYIFWLRVVFGTGKPVNVVYGNVYEKGADTTSSRFVWDTEYASAIDGLRKAAVPREMHDVYLPDMIADRLENLMALALYTPKARWKRSRFYLELKEDMARSGFRLPPGAGLYLSLPCRRMRKMYAWLSDAKRKVGIC